MYFAALVPLVALDAVWLGYLARGFYAEKLGFLFNAVKPGPAIIFYLLYAVGLVYFVVRPTAGEPLFKIFLTGALFGLCAYAAYDLTNQATIEGWPVIATLADLAWGAFASGAAATVAAYLTRA